MKKTAIFTISSKNYYAEGYTCLESILKVHPDFDYYYLLADDICKEFSPNNTFFTMILAKDIGIPNFQSIAFKYNIIEFNTAIKPFFIEYLFNKGYEKVFYFDPDIYVYNQIDKAFNILDNYSVIITPHICNSSMYEKTINRMEFTFLKVGTFNLGFIGFRNTNNAHRFINCWKYRCENEGFIEGLNNTFVDQKWINIIAPLFNNDIYILKDLGYNFAYWNLHERKLDKNNLVNGTDKLVFFHFSSFPFYDANKISKQLHSIALSERFDLIQLANSYKKQLMENEYEYYKKLKYTYSTFTNNILISNYSRHIYLDYVEKYSKPFNVGENTFYEFLCKRKKIQKILYKEIGKNNLKSKSNKKLKVILRFIVISIITLLGKEHCFNKLNKLIDYSSSLKRRL